jgi:rubredoxin
MHISSMAPIRVSTVEKRCKNPDLRRGYSASMVTYCGCSPEVIPLSFPGCPLKSNPHPPAITTDLVMKRYMCVICGFIYEEERGLPEEGIAPGTKWEDIPLNWKCPECGAGKEDFELVEI